jgi:hypothetical protein
MSSLGEARPFFEGDGPFTLARFRAWVTDTVLAASADGALAIVEWLPSSLLARLGARQDHAEFVRNAVRGFLVALSRMQQTLLAPAGGAAASASVPVPEIEEPAPPEENDTLLDLLFDAGLLPSYAFPTDLAGFVVFGWDDDLRRMRVKERAQQGKDKALSEYAPGRLLVIDKQTYRVGGIFVDDPRVLNPGDVLFGRPLPVYVSCPLCTYVELRADRSQVAEPCPVCQTPLAQRLMLDPPAFSPEAGGPLREGDRGQEISYATEAQLPTPIRAVELPWQPGPGPYLRIAYQENQELVIANHGPRHEGFRVCQSCGAAWPDRDVPAGGRHVRPYPITGRHRRAGIGSDCSGRLRDDAIFLGHTFRTDILLLQVTLCRPLSYGPREPWLHDALRTLAEAISLAAGRLLSIDPGELAAGYRLMPATGTLPEAVAAVELYLFDTAAGGAGYAAESGERLGDILSATQSLLDGCPSSCERSCTQCLRHYGNRFWHERMDRRLASRMLQYMRHGVVPAPEPLDTQAELLAPLGRYLELEGWDVALDGVLGQLRVPMIVQSASGPVFVGVYPALLDSAFAAREHPVRRLTPAPRSVVLINDYVLSRDLPSAYQRFRNGAAT